MGENNPSENITPHHVDSSNEDNNNQSDEVSLHQQHDGNDIFVNLIDRFSDAELSQIGSEVVENYKKDLSSRNEWETKRKEWAKLFFGDLDKKTYPWKDASNICVPIITTSVIQFQAKAYEALIPAKGIVNVLPLNNSDKYRDIADRVETLMNIQTKFKIEGYEDGIDKTLMALAIDGTVVRKAYFDAINKTPRVDYINAEDFVIDYNARSIKASQRCTHCVLLYQNEIAERISSGIFKNISYPDHGSQIDISVIKEQTNKSMGTEQPTDDKDSPIAFLEQHTLLLIPEIDENIKQPVIILVEKNTQKPVRIVSRINPHTGKPIEYFTEYHFLPNPYGFYGIGFGQLLEKINIQINTSINHLNDAALLSNTKAGFVLKKSGMKKGDITIGQGSFHEIDLHVDDIRKAIQVLDFGQPSMVVFQLLGLMKEYVQELTTVSELTTGAMPSSDTPATTVMSLIEQGMKVFSNIHRRIHRSLTRELKTLYELNSIYLDLDEYFNIVAPDELLNSLPQSAPQEIVQKFMQDVFSFKTKIASDFLQPLIIQPVSDPNVISRVEKMAKAQFVYQSVLQNPITSQDPQKIMFALEDYLRAMEVPHSTITKLVSIPEPQQPPDLPQEEENRLFFQEKPTDALPNQDHEDHLRSIDDLENSVIYDQMPKTGKNQLTAHKNQHMGFIYEQQAMALKQGLLHPTTLPQNKIQGIPPQLMQGLGGQPTQ